MPVDTKPYRTVEMPEAGTPEWLKIRRTTGIGASEIAAVLGQSPWATALDVYLEKRGLKTVEESRAMRRGNALEPFIRSEFEAEAGFTGIKPTYMCVSEAHPYLFCNLDWLSKDGKFGAEFKSSDNAHEWGESHSQEVPLHYYLQVQHQLLVTGLDVIYLVVLLPYSDLRIYPISSDAEVQGRITIEGKSFWHKVLSETPPVENGSVEAVKTLYSKVSGEELVIDSYEALDLIARHEEAVKGIKDLEEIKEQCEARLFAMMGDARKAKIDGWRGSITRSETPEKHVSYTRKAGLVCRINHPRTGN